MTELDSKWEMEIKELAKTDIISAYEEVHKEICDRCPREECHQDCAFLHRVIRHMLVQAKGK